MNHNLFIICKICYRFVLGFLTYILSRLYCINIRNKDSGSFIQWYPLNDCFSPHLFRRYTCNVSNILGSEVTTYRVTLEGHDFDTATPVSPLKEPREPGIDMRSLLIAGAVVGGIVLLVAIVVSIVVSAGCGGGSRRSRTPLWRMSNSTSSTTGYWWRQIILII